MALRKAELSRSSEGLNKSTYSLRDLNKSLCLYSMGLEEVSKALDSLNLGGSLEEVMKLLDVPVEKADVVSQLVLNFQFVKMMLSDVVKGVSFDQQLVHVIQLKNAEYLKAFRGHNNFSESTIARMEAVDKTKARLHTAQQREKKANEEKNKKAQTGFQSGFHSGKGRGNNRRNFSTRWDPYHTNQTPNNSSGSQSHAQGQNYQFQKEAIKKCPHCHAPAHPGFPWFFQKSKSTARKEQSPILQTF